MTKFRNNNEIAGNTNGGYKWFGVQNSEEAEVITLFGICGGLIKLSLMVVDGFFSSNVFKCIVDTINDLDVCQTIENNTLLHRTPKSQRIAILEKDLQFYCDKVSKIERSISSAMETPPIPPLPLSAKSRKMNIKDINDSSLGPISMKRELREVCDLSLEEIGHVFDLPYANLEIILGYGFIHGKEQHQCAIKTAISGAVKIVAEKKGLRSAVDLAFTPDVRQTQESSSRVPDWVQLYVKLETKLPDSGSQTILKWLNLGRSEVRFCLLVHA